MLDFTVLRRSRNSMTAMGSEDCDGSNIAGASCLDHGIVVASIYKIAGVRVLVGQKARTSMTPRALSTL